MRCETYLGILLDQLRKVLKVAMLGSQKVEQVVFLLLLNKSLQEGLSVFSYKLCCQLNYVSEKHQLLAFYGKIDYIIENLRMISLFMKTAFSYPPRLISKAPSKVYVSSSHVRMCYEYGIEVFSAE